MSKKPYYNTNLYVILFWRIQQWYRQVKIFVFFFPPQNPSRKLIASSSSTWNMPCVWNPDCSARLHESQETLLVLLLVQICCPLFLMFMMSKCEIGLIQIHYLFKLLLIYSLQYLTDRWIVIFCLLSGIRGCKV